MANSADPDQLASSLFAKAGHIHVQQDLGLISVIDFALSCKGVLLNP